MHTQCSITLFKWTHTHTIKPPQTSIVTRFSFRCDGPESDAEVLASFASPIHCRKWQLIPLLHPSVPSTQRRICRQPLWALQLISSWYPVSLPASACRLVWLWNLTGLTAMFSRSSCHETVISNPSAHVFVSGCDLFSFSFLFFCFSSSSEDRVIEHYKKLSGQSRGQAIVK